MSAQADTEVPNRLCLLGNLDVYIPNSRQWHYICSSQGPVALPVPKQHPIQLFGALGWAELGDSAIWTEHQSNQPLSTNKLTLSKYAYWMSIVPTLSRCSEGWSQKKITIRLENLWKGLPLDNHLPVIIKQNQGGICYLRCPLNEPVV